MTDIIELVRNTAKQVGFHVEGNMIFAESSHQNIANRLTKFAQLLQQGEAVATILSRDGDYNFIHWHTPLQKIEVGTQLFTTPPDTKQKLDKARERLTKMACLTQTENLLWWQIEARQALKDIS